MLVREQQPLRMEKRRILLLKFREWNEREKKEEEPRIRLVLIGLQRNKETLITEHPVMSIFNV